MKPKRNRKGLSGHIGLDFIDNNGTRQTSFQLVINARAVAIVDIVGGAVLRCLATNDLEEHMPAIRRLAFIHQRKSTPADYSINAIRRRQSEKSKV